MPSSLAPLVEDMLSAVERSDFERFRACSGRLWDEAQRSDPDTLTAALELIAPTLERMHGVFAKVALLSGELVELGASPLPLVDALPQQAAFAMELHAMFPGLWEKATGGQPLPDRTDAALIRHVRSQLDEYARRTGITQLAASAVALSWFDLDDWLSPLITVMQRREFRARMNRRDAVRDNAAALADRDECASWVYGLSLVLDDEPLIVLDPATGRGFRLVLGGVGDNLQLHTLLADRLIGDPRRGLLAGERPEPAWVAAATAGWSGPFPGTAPITRRFRLFDGHGEYVFPEGRPADITPLDGMRVIVLHPPKGDFGWMHGRVYQQMEPTLTLDRVLDPAEAEHWLSRVAPARENDLMGLNSN